MFSWIETLRNAPTFQRVIFVILPLMHLTGLLGLQFSVTQPFFKTLVPFHLFACLILLLLFHLDWNRSAVIFCIITYITGFTVEVLGVHTGLIFGQYLYGNTLGVKLMEVPLVIGVNWLALVYSVGIIVDKWRVSDTAKAFLAAGAVSGIDVFIEPVAIRLDFWSWAGDVIPLQNYIAWYIISFCLFCLFYQCSFKKQNRLAGLFLLCQVLFFVAHNVTYIFGV